MQNIKDQIFMAIEDITENITDQHPKNWALFPAVQYCEEENKVHQWTSNKEQSSYVRYRFDIWDEVSTSATALKIDEKVSALGLKRIQCTDVEDPSGYKHKLMRYEGVINPYNDRVTHI